MRFLPNYVRRDLRKIGIPRIFGERTHDWAEGERFKSGDVVIYCKDGHVVSVRSRTELNWLWRNDT